MKINPRKFRSSPTIAFKLVFAWYNNQTNVPRKSLQRATETRIKSREWLNENLARNLILNNFL